MRVALVHDWLTGMRGGERVLEELLCMYPDADVYALICAPGRLAGPLAAAPVRTSSLNHLPFVERYYRYLLPLLPDAIERLDVSGYDLVISSSHCVAKGVMARGARHLCYCHTPMRYAWDESGAYFAAGRLRGFRRRLFAPLGRRLREWDARTAQRVHLFVANSEHVRRRIRRCYGRNARTVHPPVRLDAYRPGAARDDFHVCAGALVPYKRIDLAIAAFNRSGRRLLIVGDGPQYRTLRRLAGRTVTFTGRVPDRELAHILGRARGLIMPMCEDFGIIAVEAQAAGAPVIAFAAGGALETVIPGVTGVLFASQTIESLNAAVDEAADTAFDTAAMQANARRFSPALFREGIRNAVDELFAADAMPARAGSA